MLAPPVPKVPSTRISEQALTWLGWVVLFAAALLLLYRLGEPANGFRRPGGGPVTYVHDECYQAFTAHRYALGDPQAWNPRAKREHMESFSKDDMSRWTTYEWVHPPTAKLVMAAFIRALGFSSYAYRLGSMLFGWLTLLLTWRLATRLLGPLFGLLALLLLAVDGMWFVFSRVAMNDIYVTGCVTAAMYAAYRFWTGTQRRAAWLAAAGALFGLGLSMKWNSAPIYLGVAALTLGRLVYERARPGGRDGAFRAHLGAWLVGFVFAPPALYLLSYVPYFLLGHGLSDWATLQREIWHYHQSLKAGHSQSSVWWEWPLLTRPLWMFTLHTPEGSRVIYALGNPLLWWLFLPALAHVAQRYLKLRQPGDGLILCGFFGAWLPWAFVGRVTFIQYLLPGVPFGVLAVATLLRDMTGAAGRWRLWLAGAYATLCVATFLHFYPILSAALVSRESLAGRQWFWIDSWRGY